MEKENTFSDSGCFYWKIFLIIFQIFPLPLATFGRNSLKFPFSLIHRFPLRKLCPDRWLCQRICKKKEGVLSAWRKAEVRIFAREIGSHTNGYSSSYLRHWNIFRTLTFLVKTTSQFIKANFKYVYLPVWKTNLSLLRRTLSKQLYLKNMTLSGFTRRNILFHHFLLFFYKFFEPNFKTSMTLNPSVSSFSFKSGIGFFYIDWKWFFCFVFFSGSIREVYAVVKQSASLPCDISSSVEGDSVILVVWYKDEMTPIYR